ncbi:MULTISPECIES: acetyl/propionyl/methylcrotonyl-CoA carboxylase subunit alpha [unclassified Haematospirillum]|uniref:acetyl-CoA carboxylase biotin carboxylase subunit n=1 Tax=unclassified Haematospirillum TaxID=2622088 RepID=UPI00143C5A0F|nr:MULTISPECIES: acetyl/propionyl/methylcrotonyl-CoA carboxylase subunit alpha [unclassified Haematospirillum]NKD54393.1 acetyl/propionyl/methylcrotonyl-CoA carboxylase subunit alpha [Haematospirillum sp. H4890]NKD74436.1 acetyl/propionyl/methylcrotonyl-CoA carboxylase subunit alpha [Haematospirillum sp. H4485]NKD86893.1 acetyl/propionyl/methylcrotonyl-CoA carboxylase subunit alpha [Haematospirillum sp. 15-248]
MFRKILVANRGEVACRIIRTAHRMGIATVAVYSEADAGALHVDMADEAVCIGPAPARQSYLLIDRIVRACRDVGADAVHPGYGFLSENSVFPEALQKEGIVFIGPPVEAIRLMGDKIRSRELARKAGLSVIPGYDGAVSTEDRAVGIANDIGLPVMIKASAGGGGKGMRIAHTEADVREGFRHAASEARSAFGDDRLLLEKYISNPRHIEIQILSDGETCLHVYERECSIQRRHQKIMEEAPSPFLDGPLRQAMVNQAVVLARSVDYRSAGTVEFIVDEQRQFYFLEMNTRLQVEHPVTECVTGLDLVEWMIRIAAGERLTLSQDEIVLKGWAMESRIYAEDPGRGFVPSSGRLVRYREPEPENGVRVDSGVCEGGEISVHYDPLIAKLVTWGQNRGAAIRGMQTALGGFYIRGITSNIPLLCSIVRHKTFMAGACTTGFVDAHGQEVVSMAPSSAYRVTMACIMAVVHRLHTERVFLFPTQNGNVSKQATSYSVVVCFSGSCDLEVKLERQSCVEGLNAWSVFCGGLAHHVVSGWQIHDPIWHGTVNGKGVVAQVERKGTSFQMHVDGFCADIIVLDLHVAALNRMIPSRAKPDLSRFLLSPMPGFLISIDVSEGQTIKAGERLAVVEAMKMENVLRAEQDATVKKIHVAAGGSISVDQVIMEFS